MQLINQLLYTAPSQFLLHVLQSEGTPAMSHTGGFVIYLFGMRVVYNECTWTCFLSSLSWWYLSHLWAGKLKLGEKSEDVLWQNIIFIFWLINSLIKYLIIIDIFITYLFSFSSGQYLRYLLSEEANIWRWQWTSALAIKGIFDLLMNQLIDSIFD